MPDGWQWNMGFKNRWKTARSSSDSALAVRSWLHSVGQGQRGKIRSHTGMRKLDKNTRKEEKLAGTSTDFEWHYWRSFWIRIGFIDHFNTQLVITVNYSVIADFHNIPITAVHAKSFPACSVSIRSFLVTATNNGYSSTFLLKSPLKGGTLPTANSCLN
jgi:hypothetical protein